MPSALHRSPPPLLPLGIPPTTRRHRQSARHLSDHKDKRKVNPAGARVYGDLSFRSGVYRRARVSREGGQRDSRKNPRRAINPSPAGARGCRTQHNVTHKRCVVAGKHRHRNLDFYATARRAIVRRLRGGKSALSVCAVSFATPTTVMWAPLCNNKQLGGNSFNLLRELCGSRVLTTKPMHHSRFFSSPPASCWSLVHPRNKSLQAGCSEGRKGIKSEGERG